jgi:uncharacterized protein YegJ (DUF2314 family)
MTTFLLLTLSSAMAAAPPSWVADARSGLALYCAPTCSEETIAALEGALEPIPQRRRLPRSAGEPVRSMGLVLTEDFGRPDIETLGALANGVGDAAEEQLAASEEVLIVSYAAPRERIMELNRAVYQAFEPLVGQGVVEELGSGRLFDAAGFAEHAALVTAAPLDASAFFVLEVTGDEGDDRSDLETMGLRAIGLHDMRVESLEEDQLDDYAALLNALAQLSWEQGGVASRSFVSESALELPGARYRAVGIEGTAYAHSAQSTWSTRADPLVIIGFDGRFDADPVEALSAYPAAMVDAPLEEPAAPVVEEPAAPVVEEPPAPVVEEPPAPVVEEPAAPVVEEPAAPVVEEPPAPVEEDPTTQEPAGGTPAEAQPSPPSLLEIQASALSRLDGPVRASWDGGLPSGDRLYVKAPFQAEDGAVEYLWVQVVSWRAQSIDGVLRSDPQWVRGVTAGDVVSVEQARVFDYLWRHADGSSEGNETEAFLP